MVNLAEPKRLSAFEGKFVVSVSCGPFHSVAACMGSASTSSDSVGRLDVFVWGKVGKLKDSTPHMLESLRKKCVLNISCNMKSTVAVISKIHFRLQKKKFLFFLFSLKINRFKGNSFFTFGTSV